jgi:hypothetical protein
MENVFKDYIILGHYEIEKPKEKGSERSSIIKEIYKFYQDDKQNRKKENWKRYCQWCRDNHKPKGSEQSFKKTKLYIKELPVKVIAIKLSHVPTKDLYYIKSECFDKFSRGENVGSYLLGSIKISNYEK